MQIHPLRRRATIAIAVASLTVLASCSSTGNQTATGGAPGAGNGGNDISATGGGGSVGGGNDGQAGSSGLTAATVTNLADDQSVDLEDFAPRDKPLLVWFWAPH